jgi:FkbM family methyltransferase
MDALNAHAAVYGDRQHAPAGELPAGFHPSFWEGAADRDARRARVYMHFLRPGELAFDIGANCGEVTQVMLALGCRVVAVEPQPHIAALIDPKASVVVAACGAEKGRLPMFENANPYLTSLSRQVADAAVQSNSAWSYRQVDDVRVVTLDSLILEHGLPRFCKIDVEGFEAEVLRGLSWPLPALSFEVHNFDTAKIGACVERLDSLGDYGYLYSRAESYELEPFPPRSYAFFGDVYASLRTAEP